MLEKTTRINFLYDFYQSLLTDKQRAYMRAYYLEDLSLGEIADIHDVSRQAIYDNVKRTEKMLEEYESKLQLFERFERRMAAIQSMEAALENDDRETVKEVLKILKRQE